MFLVEKGREAGLVLSGFEGNGWEGGGWRYNGGSLL